MDVARRKTIPAAPMKSKAAVAATMRVGAGSKNPYAARGSILTPLDRPSLEALHYPETQPIVQKMKVGTLVRT